MNDALHAGRVGQTGPFGPFPDPLTGLLADVESVATFALVASAVYLLGRFLLYPAVVRTVRARNRYNPTIQAAVETYLVYLLLAVALMSGVVAAGFTSLADPALIVAAITLAVGVAGREAIGSLVSGMFLIADPDFNVGDFVSWPGGEGEIQEIDFRVTRIRTPAYETLTVPNTELTTNALVRPYGRKRARVDETVHLAYDDDVGRACDLLAEIAREDDRVLSDPEPDAIVDSLGEGLVTLRTVFWVDDPTMERVGGARVRFRGEVVDRLPAAGITLGPPSGQDLSGEVAITSPEPDGDDPAWRSEGCGSDGR